MYAGTGEGYFREEIRGTGLPLRGSGIFVTSDGGRSWQQLPATNTRRLLLGQRSGAWRQRYAAHLCRDAHRASGDRTDGGATWTRLLAVNVRGGCLDLALRPDRIEDVLFASCGSYEQATVYRFPRAADRSDVEVVLREAEHGPHLARDCAVEPRRRCTRWRRATTTARAATIGRACSPSIAAIAAARPARGKRASPTATRTISTRCC